jgi:endoribonuclease Dicer
LDTGTGKTLIALLLLKHVASIERLQEPRRSIFLVPTVPLVTQQANYIESNSRLRAKKYSGNMGSRSWGRDDWKAELCCNDVLVMTPDILLNSLDHGFLNLSQVLQFLAFKVIVFFYSYY